MKRMIIASKQKDKVVYYEDLLNMYEDFHDIPSEQLDYLLRNGDSSVVNKMITTFSLTADQLREVWQRLKNADSDPYFKSNKDRMYIVLYNLVDRWRDTPADVLKECAQFALSEGMPDNFFELLMEHPNATKATKQMAKREIKRQEDEEGAKDKLRADIRNRNGRKWPLIEELHEAAEDPDYFDEVLWPEYIGPAEEQINKKYQIFPEPSVQGGQGTVFLHDESGKGYEPVEVDYQDWCDWELDAAIASRSAKEFAKKYDAYISELLTESK